MSSHCKHEWEDRTDILRTVFAASPEHALHSFVVCRRCMRIREDEAENLPTQSPLLRILKAA